MNALGDAAVEVINADGASPFVLVCDHASHFIPPEYGEMGLTLAERLSHIAWDPGALEVSRGLSSLLDAPLVASRISRLVIDANRDESSPGLIWTLSEKTRIAANENLSAAERQHRIDAFHRPYHAAIESVLAQREVAGQAATLVCVHSFTPVFHGIARPWEIGLIHGKDDRYTSALRSILATEAPNLTIGWNEPYSALSGVTHTLEHHGDGRGLDATMIELRNNEILEPRGVAYWAELLARCLSAARVSLPQAPPHLSKPLSGATRDGRD